MSIPTSTTAERPHAERSASQLGSLALCLGFRPRRTARKHWVTQQGERGHAALETGDTSGLESTFEERMVKLCADYEGRLPAASQVFSEIRVETIEGRWGYFDRIRIRAAEPDVADLCDWKFVRAKEVTDAEHNLQGKDYVVGAFEDPRFAGVNTIHVHFAMPRLGTVTRHTFTRADIPRLKLEIFAIIRRARKTDHPGYKGRELNPNFETCTYCGAAGECPALARIADRIYAAYDPEGHARLEPLPEEFHASKVKDPAIRGRLQAVASVMEEWAKSVRHHNLTAAMDDPKQVPAGYVIDYQQGKRKVVNPAALVLVAKEFGVEITDLVDAAQLSWGKVEQALKDRAPRGQKTHVVTAFHQRLEELDAVERPEAAPRLVKDRPSPSA